MMKNQRKYHSILEIVSISLALIYTIAGCNMTKTKSPEIVHDVAIKDVKVSSTCSQGDTVPITVSLTNQGTRREMCYVKLTEEASGKEIATKEMALAKGWKDGSVDFADVVFDAEETGIQQFGDGVRSKGDINGDNLEDILICASTWNSSRGRVYLYYGGDNVDPYSPDAVFSGEDPNTYLGSYTGISTCDLNRDGFDDIILGAGGYNNYDGRVYIYNGGPKVDTKADMVLEGEPEKNGMFGHAIASSDIDCDGYEDVVVGAQTYDQGRGRVYLFWGGEQMDTVADILLEGEGYPGGKYVIDYGTRKVQGLFGRQIVASGDVNGDGYKDILVGARHAFDHNYNGSAYLFFGNTKQKMDAISDCVFRGEHPRAQMGSSLELFDIDNDGFDDVIVGARFARNWRGAVYIWWGAKDFNGNRPADAVLEGEPRSNMGADEIACGYFNNDHYGDILVGAPTYPGADTTRGRAYIFFGNRKSLFNTCRDITFEGEFGNCPQRFGIALSSGNLNGDKHDDVVFGAWGYKNNQGRAYLYYGPFSDTENISFNWDTTNASIGTHTLKVEIPPVPGEKNTEDNVKTITIDVKAPSL